MELKTHSIGREGSGMTAASVTLRGVAVSQPKRSSPSGVSSQSDLMREPWVSVSARIPPMRW